MFWWISRGVQMAKRYPKEFKLEAVRGLKRFHQRLRLLQSKAKTLGAGVYGSGRVRDGRSGLTVCPGNQSNASHGILEVSGPSIQRP